MAILKDGYLYDLTPSELINWVSDVGLDVISNWTVEELLRIGWLGNPIVRRLYTLTDAGVWISARDASGRAPVVEQNSADIRTYTIQDKVLGESLSRLARLKDAGGSPTTNVYPLKRSSPITGTVSTGAIAAEDLIAAVGGKQLYVEELEFSLSASGNHEGGVVTVKDGDGTTLGAVIISSMHPYVKMWGLLPGAEGKKITFELSSSGGLVSLTDGDIVIATALYREL